VSRAAPFDVNLRYGAALAALGMPLIFGRIVMAAPAQDIAGMQLAAALCSGYWFEPAILIGASLRTYETAAAARIGC
jgi:ABC-2 type transport system permease protein